MSERRVATVLLALLVVLWVGGCAATAPGPGEVEVSGSAPPARLTAYEDLGEVSVAAVQDLWGQDALAWPVRVELPASSAQFDELTGINSAQTAVPASTVGSLKGAHIVVHPDSWSRLTAEGRQAVLTHEVTHLAQQGDGPVPAWLGEGIAEYTAHRGSTLPPAQIAGSALDGVRDGKVPSAWPDPAGADTSTSRGTSAGATTGSGVTTGATNTATNTWGGYALSWLACLYIADTWGEAALLELYDQIATGTPVPDAIESVLGVTQEQALSGWGQWLRDVAAQ